MTARIGVSEDLAKNEAHLKRIAELFSVVHSGSTLTTSLLPWFPSPTRRATKDSTTELFTLLHTYVENRRQVEPTGEAIDILIADGETTQIIVEVFLPLYIVEDVKFDPAVPVHDGGAYRRHLCHRQYR